MATTLREILHNIRLLTEEFGPEILNVPVVSEYSASGESEGIYGPYTGEADDLQADITGLEPGDMLVRFVIDH